MSVGFIRKLPGGGVGPTSGGPAALVGEFYIQMEDSSMENED